MIRVLVANIPLPGNRFLVDLNGAIGELCDLEQSSDAFWAMTGEYDVVHLHFPEYMTYEIEACYQRGLGTDMLAAVEDRLRHWAERSAIVVTWHVLLPHDARKDVMWERMYETVFRYSDAVVHFANASIAEFNERYRKTSFHRGAPRHVVIPHANYASLPNRVSRSEARESLGVPVHASVLLVFGSVRSDEESRLILDVFRGIDQPRPVLLVSRWREKLAAVSWIRLRTWLRDINRVYYKLHPRYNFNYGYVKEEDTQLYLNAADVLLIPRLRVLNSGNIALGMTFGRVVVGPDSWNVGELLRETGNPVFDPDDPQTAVAATDRAFRLAREGKTGAANRQLALTAWSVQKCAEKYGGLFTELSAARADSFTHR